MAITLSDKAQKLYEHLSTGIYQNSGNPFRMPPTKEEEELVAAGICTIRFRKPEFRKYFDHYVFLNPMVDQPKPVGVPILKRARGEAIVEDWNPRTNKSDYWRIPVIGELRDDGKYGGGVQWHWFAAKEKPKAKNASDWKRAGGVLHEDYVSVHPAQISSFEVFYLEEVS